MPISALDDNCIICGGFPCGFKSKGRIVAPNVIKPAEVITQCRNPDRDVLYYPPIVGWMYDPATDKLHYCFVPETTPLLCLVALTRKKPMQG